MCFEGEAERGRERQRERETEREGGVHELLVLLRDVLLDRERHLERAKRAAHEGEVALALHCAADMVDQHQHRLAVCRCFKPLTRPGGDGGRDGRLPRAGRSGYQHRRPELEGPLTGLVAEVVREGVEVGLARNSILHHLGAEEVVVLKLGVLLKPRCIVVGLLSDLLLHAHQAAEHGSQVVHDVLPQLLGRVVLDRLDRAVAQPLLELGKLLRAGFIHLPVSHVARVLRLRSAQVDVHVCRVHLPPLLAVVQKRLHDLQLRHRTVLVVRDPGEGLLRDIELLLVHRIVAVFPLWRAALPAVALP